MDNKNKFSTDKIIPIVITILSLLNIVKNSNNLVSLTVLLSLLGVFSAILIFLKNPISTKLVYIWLVAQIIVIEPIFDLTQILSFKFGVNLENASINLNILPIIALGIIKIIEASNLVGKVITLKKFRDGELDNILPLNGTITKRISLENEKNWLLVELDKSFNYEGNTVNQILVKRKDDKTIKLKEKKQYSFLRIVVNENDLNNTSDKSKFPFIDWILCE